jgi:hypothetical protein
MYQEAIDYIMSLFQSGVIDWIKFYKNGNIGIKFKIEPSKILFDKNTPSETILEFIENYEE